MYCYSVPSLLRWERTMQRSTFSHPMPGRVLFLYFCSCYVNHANSLPLFVKLLRVFFRNKKEANFVSQCFGRRNCKAKFI